MHRRSFLAGGSALAALSALPARALAQTAAAPGDAALNAAFDQVLEGTLMRSPENATQLGLDKGDKAGLRRQLDDYSLAAVARDRAATKRDIATVEAVDPATLSARAKLDREVILYNLRADAVAPERFNLSSVIRPYRITQQQGAYFGVPDFLASSHPVATGDDADAYLARLEGFATALDQDSAAQEELAKRGLLAPDFSVDLALQQLAKLRGTPAADSGLVTSLAERAAAANLAGDWKGRAAAIVSAKVYPALDRQIALMRRLRPSARKEAGLWAVRDGEAIYAAALEQATTTSFTPDEVHRMGLEQVADLSGQLDAILKGEGMTQGSIGARLAALNASPAQLYPDTAEGRTALIAGLNQGNAAMQAKLGRAFNNPSNAPLEIRAVPVEIQDGASNGYYYRAPLDGSRPAIYWINLKSVGDWPRYSLPSLTYHEGVPGHHLQISTAQGGDAHPLRKISFFGAYLEGWALYAEQLADELGGYATPVERAGYLQSFLFRAARLVVDTGIHTKRWTREQGTRYFVDNVGFAQPRSQREIERYCTQPGQACSYKLGHASWLRAREKARSILGTRFDLRQFHEVLRDGALPLTMLEQIVEQRARAMA